MTSEITPEGNEKCQLKIGLDTRKTGQKSGARSENAPENDAKEAQPIPIATPETENPIQSPVAESCLLSPTSITTQDITTPEISAVCASDAILPMTQTTMHEPAAELKASADTTANPRSLIGKKTNKQLMQHYQKTGDKLQLTLKCMTLEAYKPAMDALKLYLEIHGSQSPNFYMTRNKQVIAACQMNGINDPNATRKQRLAAITCYEMIHEAITQCLELGLGKEETKKELNDAVAKAAEFFGLGNKKAVKARNKRKAA
jgi:hypothetical protein